MIRYKSDLFGLRTLTIWNGSAALRAILPATLSTGVCWVYSEYANVVVDSVENSYTIGVLVTFFGFLLTTRLNYSYGRWWEAATMIHRMTSKCADSAVCLAAFHYQSATLYDLPPTFGTSDNVSSQTSSSNLDNDDSERLTTPSRIHRGQRDGRTLEETKAQLNSLQSNNGRLHSNESSMNTDRRNSRTSLMQSSEQEGSGSDRVEGVGIGGTAMGVFRWIQNTVLGVIGDTSQETGGPHDSDRSSAANGASVKYSMNALDLAMPQRANSEPIRLPTKSFQPNRKLRLPVAANGAFLTGSVPKVPTASPFLQELLHLYSLLNAVAMASLRHDVEGCPSPLTTYLPNQPFPPYNPNEFQISQQGHLLDIFRHNSGNSAHTYESFESEEGNVFVGWIQEELSRAWVFLYFLMGIDRSPKQRTLYNAVRPFAVLGGVSDYEAKRLQQARGSMAKLALCQLWLKEFVAREHLNGSTGKVAPPIVGRVLHFLTDAIAAYHQCRKVAYVPFPFPHAQMTSLFVSLLLLVFPILYVGYVNQLALACILNFTTVLCFTGIHEVARELSNPYNTVPNDLPLNRFHAEFNESLRSLLNGYHPDWVQQQQRLQQQQDQQRLSSTPGGPPPLPNALQTAQELNGGSTFASMPDLAGAVSAGASGSVG